MKVQRVTPEAKIMYFLTTVMLSVAIAILCISGFGYKWYEDRIGSFIQQLKAPAPGIEISPAHYDAILKATSCKITQEQANLFNPTNINPVQKPAYVLRCQLTLNATINAMNAQHLTAVQQAINEFSIVTGDELKVQSGNQTIESGVGEMTLEALKGSKRV